ncbi:MAG: DUF4416 family protein [Deferribacterota bacterium]|nr:DUF4416 family protein [Deferribacterota bacterium]
MTVSNVKKVIYFNALTFGPYNIETINDKTKLVLGQVLFNTKVFDFIHTDYYNDKMVTPLKKCFIVYTLIDYPHRLPVLKRLFVNLEKKYIYLNKRMFNIDIGYIALEKIVVASTKNFSHRIYLKGGIYGDLQFIRKDGKYRPLQWTFQDYKQDFVLSFFERARNYLKKLI